MQLRQPKNVVKVSNQSVFTGYLTKIHQLTLEHNMKISARVLAMYSRCYVLYLSSFVVSQFVKHAGNYTFIMFYSESTIINVQHTYTNQYRFFHEYVL